MDEKIATVLDRLEKQEKYELDNHDKVPHQERMLAITPSIGKFYNILLRAAKATSVLEIGTSVGYSTIWFADALRESLSSSITTIEVDQNKIKQARKNFADSGVDDIIEIRQGDALDVLNKIYQEADHKSIFDFVFIDADKERYREYFDLSFKLVKVGGIIAADNILKPERFGDMMRDYQEHVRKNTKILSVTVPIDNGEEISFKLDD
ncbi:MAG: O-methyltransferase [Nitrosarchaeum sp.]|nr:O-methyltransferase [Nitrosarchaeum sp.]